MSLAELFVLDLVAICVLVFAVYLPRHRRRDLVFALLGVNVGVLAVTQALSSANVSAGLGLGLFGVLSIIRLRSTEMDQVEVGYYFSAIALGLLGGFLVTPSWLNPVLMATIVVVAVVADHPAVYGSYRQQSVLLDRAYPDEAAARDRAEELVGMPIQTIIVRRVDLVQDTTLVDIGYRRRPAAACADDRGKDLEAAGWSR